MNNKIYVGVHETFNLEDGYMGSGKVIRAAIEKHGIINFRKDILEFFEDSETMYAREKEIVSDEFLLREDTYNLRRGGTGGFDYINQTGKNMYGKNGENGKQYLIPLYEQGHSSEKMEEIYAKISSTLKEKYADGSLISTFVYDNPMKNENSRLKQKETMLNNNHQQGDKNSQSGTMWITNGTENKKIKKDANIPDGWYKGRKI